MTREDKEAIIRRLEAIYGEAEDNETKEALFYAIEALKGQRPRGEWRDFSDEGFVECPFCEHATTCNDDIEELHYCFFCGSELRKSGKAE